MTTGHVALAFRKRFKRSPFHLEDEKVLRPSVQSLFRAFENLDPPPHRQKAITPKFLRKLFKLSGAGLSAMRDTAPAVTAELSIVAFFYAMRSWEHTTSRISGRKKIIDIGHVTFSDRRKCILPFPCNVSDAEYVTITFKDQKNGKKMDVRTQQRTGDPILCPVL
jgi:hypothetical protein